MTKTPGKRRLALHWKIVIGLALGVGVGLAINLFWTAETWAALGVNDPASFLSDKVSVRQASEMAGAINKNADFGAHAARFFRFATAFTGDLFLRGLQFIAVPIVLFSLIVGASSLNDASKLGRIGGRTIVLYLCTTALAITIGLILANLIAPGRGFSDEARVLLSSTGEGGAADSIAKAAGRSDYWQTLLNIVPKNPFSALADTMMLQVVFAALLIGVALTRLPDEKAAAVINFCDAMTDVIIQIVHWVLMLAPVAVFALIVEVVADLGIGVLGSLLKYSLTVVAGLAIMIFAVYPGVLRVFTRVGYARFFRAISPAQLLAFSSASSGATLPVTMECCEERLGISEEITSFVIPLGATVNMDGTALYQGVAAVFIAQLFGIPLTFMDQLTIVLTATLASIGTAAVPGAGIIMLIIVLQTLDFPDEVVSGGIAVILAVDRILDMCRTACNVTGDCMVCTVVASAEKAVAPDAPGAAEAARSVAD
ncbi:MAG: dicarboxylate/amino acid:cation symporter [Phycisphaeraceae bacterium]|nr:MAG: dicarboxylate/amino acid:cation symporter [Phycisphaeraceae bacterium]